MKIKNIVIIICFVLLTSVTIYLNILLEEKKNTKKVKDYFELHDYYYNKEKNNYERKNIPLYSINPKSDTYELNAYARGINIKLKYNYKTKKSVINYITNKKENTAYYDHNENKFNCNDTKENCDIIEFFPQNAHKEFNNILEIADAKSKYISDKFF